MAFFFGFYCNEQALQTGQLPAELKFADDGAITSIDAAKEDAMVTDEKVEANDEPTEAEKNDDSAEMDQVRREVLH